MIVSGINESQKRQIQCEPRLHITPSCGQIYVGILDSENLDGRPRNKRLKSTLGPGIQRCLTTLKNCNRLSDAMERVARDLRTIMYDCPFGKTKAYHATLCEIVCEYHATTAPL